MVPNPGDASQAIVTYDYDKIVPSEFFKTHVRGRIPALIKGGTGKTWQPWAWSINDLVHRFNGKVITYRSPKGDQKGNFADIAKTALDDKNEQIYLRNIRITRDLPELTSELFPLPHILQGDWKSTFLLPDNWLLGKNIIELFISKPGTTFPVLHLDYWGMDGFICQIEGRKQFVLFSRSDTPNLYPNPDNPLLSEVDPFNPDLINYPAFKRASPINIELEPGDLLYNPGLWHTTQTLSRSLTIIFSTWNSGNWFDLIKEQLSVNLRKNPSKTSLVAAYLLLATIPLYTWEQWRIRRG